MALLLTDKKQRLNAIDNALMDFNLGASYFGSQVTRYWEGATPVQRLNACEKFAASL